MGLDQDLPEIIERHRVAGVWGRRGLFGLMGGLGVAAVAGCSDTTTPSGTPTSGIPSATAGSSAASPSADAPASSSGAAVDAAAGEIPAETAGPFPGDGSNGPNVLDDSGIVRSDITTSYGSGSAVAGGIPAVVKLRIYDLAGDEATPYVGAALYLWHCDREGRYSLYSDGVTTENYCRGVQVADDEGRLEFRTIFPGCYDGRWPHMHFEVYDSIDAATAGSTKLVTSQLALPRDACEEVYATGGYEDSVGNLARLSLDSDGVFSDGWSLQMAAVNGAPNEGYEISLNVPV